jgi:hypothetical protein
MSTTNTTPVITTLASFNGPNYAYSISGLIADAAGNLYATTEIGGANSDGTVFELTNTGFVVPAPPVVTLANRPAASNVATATLGTAAPGTSTDALSVALTSDADFASGSTLVLNNGTLVYTPGLVTAAKAGIDTLAYSVTDTVTGAVTAETQTVTLNSDPAPTVSTVTASPTTADLGAGQGGEAQCGLERTGVRVRRHADTATDRRRPNGAWFKAWLQVEAD